MSRFSLIILITLASCVIQEKYPVSYKQFSAFPELDSSKRSIVGVYICPLTGTFDKAGQEMVVLMILFDNNIIYTSAASINNLRQESSPCYQISDDARKIPYYWGQYYVQGDSLLIEMVNSTRSVFERFGKVEILGTINENGSVSLEHRKTSRIETLLNESFERFPCKSLPVSTNIFSQHMNNEKHL